jgi:hypothetical protein
VDIQTLWRHFRQMLSSLASKPSTYKKRYLDRGIIFY